MRVRLRAAVTAVERHGEAVLLRMKAPEIASTANPGQFVHVLCGEDSPRVLRRPYSVFQAEGEECSILFKVAGAGSRWLAGRRVGDDLDVIGPLGRGFRQELLSGDVALVAGGTGIAPLHFLALALREEGLECSLFWGMEKSSDFGSLPKRLGELQQGRLATMDGSRGEKGTVLGLLEAEGLGGFKAVCACGPQAMLGQLHRLCEKEGIPLQVSVEERMACGVGACQGCAVPVLDDPPGYRMACRDGPVFPASELDWGRMG